MKKKHYIVGVEAGSHIFEYKCNTIWEAYNAINDANLHFALCLDMDVVMVNLVKLYKNEESLCIHKRLSLEIGEGEI